MDLTFAKALIVAIGLHRRDEHLAGSRLEMVLGEVEKEQQESGCGQHRSGLAL
jgi:hypothetical protein